MQIKSLRKEEEFFLNEHNLIKKWNKAKLLFEKNINYPSLKVELLEPKWRGVYSFRLDKKYRALFFIINDTAEIFQITKHYRKS